MKIAVTGSSGFIASHLVEALAGAGHRVVAVDFRRGDYPPGVEWFGPDIMLAGPLLDVPLAGCDAVFHLAGVADVNEAAANPVHCVDLNVGGTARVLAACKRAGVPRFFLASTVWVYAATKRAGRPVDEKDPFYADGSNHVYTTSKLAAEMVTIDFARAAGIQTTVLRYGIPYGERMRPGTVLERFVTAALAGKDLTVLGSGTATRKYLYVGDLVAGHLAALSPVAANRTYTLDGAESVSVLDVAKTVLAEVNSTAPPAGRRSQVVHAPARPGDYAGNITSTARAEAELGWTPQVSFREGVRRYVQWRINQATRTPSST